MSPIPVVRIKPGVTFKRIAPGGFRILAALDGLSKVLGSDVTIAAGTNDHTAGRHPKGEAFDVSVKSWTIPVVLKAVTYLKQVLGERFAVLYETPVMPKDAALATIAYVNGNASADHLHVQVKKGTEYPPQPNMVNA